MDEWLIGRVVEQLTATELHQQGLHLFAPKREKGRASSESSDRVDELLLRRLVVVMFLRRVEGVERVSRWSRVSRVRSE